MSDNMRVLIETVTLNEYFIIPPREADTFTWGKLLDHLADFNDIKQEIEEYGVQGDQIVIKNYWKEYKVDEQLAEIRDKVKKLNLFNVPINDCFMDKKYKSHFSLVTSEIDDNFYNYTVELGLVEDESFLEVVSSVIPGWSSWYDYLIEVLDEVHPICMFREGMEPPNIPQEFTSMIWAIYEEMESWNLPEYEVFNKVAYHLRNYNFEETDRFLNNIHYKDAVEVIYNILSSYFPDLEKNTFYELGKYIHPITIFKEAELKDIPYRWETDIEIPGEIKKTCHYMGSIFNLFSTSGSESVHFKKLLELFKEGELYNMDSYLESGEVPDDTREFIKKMLQDASNNTISKFTDFYKYIHPIYSFKE